VVQWFRLTFGRREKGDDDLREAAGDARGALTLAVAAAQARGDLPDADPERLSALLLALAHGAADLQLSGQLARAGKSRADAEDLVGELFGYLARVARADHGDISLLPPRPRGSNIRSVHGAANPRRLR